jgi:heterodisulfide reductase subunit A
VIGVEGQAGDFTVSLRQEPRYVDVERCVDCGRCAEVCPIELPDDYQQRLTKRKAAYKVAPRATPDAYVIDPGPTATLRQVRRSLPSKAIDLNEQPACSHLKWAPSSSRWASRSMITPLANSVTGVIPMY